MVADWVADWNVYAPETLGAGDGRGQQSVASDKAGNSLNLLDLNQAGSSGSRIDNARKALQDQGQLHAISTEAGEGRPQITTVSDNSSGSSASSFLNYIGYFTYFGLAADMLGRDDPLQIETRAMRFFQEKILHHHAIDNPEVWRAMGDAVMDEQHLAHEGAKFKPIKLGTLQNEVKHESQEEQRQHKDMEHNAKNANDILKDISAGVKSEQDYAVAAKLLYVEAITKADDRATKEVKDHKDEKRLVGRLKLLSGETDRTSALQTADNSVAPLEDQLGAPVSFRLEAAAFMERYANQVSEPNWAEQAKELRRQAQAIYDSDALADPVRRRLHKLYTTELQDKPAKES